MIIRISHGGYTGLNLAFVAKTVSNMLKEDRIIDSYRVITRNKHTCSVILVGCVLPQVLLYERLDGYFPYVKYISEE